MNPEFVTRVLGGLYIALSNVLPVGAADAANHLLSAFADDADTPRDEAAFYRALVDSSRPVSSQMHVGS